MYQNCCKKCGSTSLHTESLQKSEMYEEVKRRIGFYRERKENNIFDDFYHSHLDYIEKCMEYYEENNKA